MVGINAYCSLDAVINTSFNPDFTALFDINHQLGVELRFSAVFERAITQLGSTEIPWAKPVLRVSNDTFFTTVGWWSIMVMALAFSVDEHYLNQFIRHLTMV